MDVNSLLDQAKEACGVSYDKDLAPRLGVRPSAISNYRKGVSHPDAVVCATLAGLTGVPLARVLGVIGEARAISREEKAVWRKLAATAMALCLAVGFALPRDVQAMPQAGNALHDIHYAKCSVGLGAIRRLRVAMAGDCHNGNAPDPTAVRPYFPTRTPAISRSPPKMPLIPGSAPKTPSISGSTSSSPLSSQLRT